jgi:FO synthase
MWTIVPLKALRPVKSRLAPVLTPRQCEGFMQAMLEDVLVALQACETIEGVLLVTRDTNITELAHKYGAQVLAPDQDEDLNSAVQAAADHLSDRGLERALVLHGDIPLIRATDLTRLLEQRVDSDLSLLPCRHGQGTNALITSLPAATSFMFGNDSYRRFKLAAEASDLRVQTLDAPAIELDVDTADDMLVLCQYYRDHGGHRQSHSYRFIENLGLLQDTKQVLEQVLGQDMSGSSPSTDQARALALVSDTKALVSVACSLRNRQHGSLVSYSRKVFIPLTHLCRDVCHYCTFAKTPRRLAKPYMSVEEVLEVARQGASLGCKEALLTLGEKPELRYSVARKALQELGFTSTLEYVAHVAQAIFEETGLLPHVNAGCMNAEELNFLRQFSPSMGIMLESSSNRLCEKGMPHYGSPDKLPAARLETIALAGEARVPFTTGILIGIGETRLERIESLLALRDLHHKYGHIQEVIIQNFRAKPDTVMANAPEPDQDDLCWTIAVARIIFGARMNIQAPPNLIPGSLEAVIDAGINDLGGISPLTPDFVNPEAPWPHLDQLAQQLDGMGKHLQQRLTVYPAFVRETSNWVSESICHRF